MDAREQVRDAIRAEVARQNPVEDARHSLELIAETAVRFEGEDSAGYRIIDENGEPRTRVANGAVVDFTIRDLIADLREKHPTLFQAAPPGDLGTPDEVDDGLSPANGLEMDASPDADLAWTDRSPAAADVPRHEPAMPTAAPFGTPIMDRRLSDPEPGSCDSTPSQASGPAPGPRDWLILDRGKRPAEVPASPPEISGAPQPSVSGLSGGPVRAAQAASGAILPSTAAPNRGPAVNPRARGGRRPATVAYAVLGGLAVLSMGAYLGFASRASGPNLLPKQAEKQADKTQAEKTRARTTPTPQSSADPVATGSVSSSPAGDLASARPSPVEPAPITGVPEVIDTATLRIDGKVVRLVGVEWARGGRGDNLTSYLGGREVTCQPAEASEFFRCKVEGRDLSQVVLYNGGGRASPNAPADLLAAENYARTERIGVWQK